MKYKTKAAVLKAACFSNPVYTVMPTRFQSKLFTSEVPTSQPSLTEANLAIRPKKIISSMLVLIPVSNGKKLYVSYRFPFSPFAMGTG